MAAVCGCAFQAIACTGIALTAADGSYVQSRTIEWARGVLQSEYVVIPRGQRLRSFTPSGADGMVFTSKYGVAGLAVVQKEFIAEGINEYPLEYRRMIYKRIEAATGESAEKIEKAYFKKLEKILKRGVIKDREEYELVHSRIDELVHNTPEDDPARKDLPELERIFMNYAIGE